MRFRVYSLRSATTGSSLPAAAWPVPRRRTHRRQPTRRTPSATDHQPRPSASGGELAHRDRDADPDDDADHAASVVSSTASSRNCTSRPAAAPRPRLRSPISPGPLPDADQHDVGDADAADEQADAGDRASTSVSRLEGSGRPRRGSAPGVTAERTSPTGSASAARPTILLPRSLICPGPAPSTRSSSPTRLVPSRPLGRGDRDVDGEIRVGAGETSPEPSSRSPRPPGTGRRPRSAAGDRVLAGKELVWPRTSRAPRPGAGCSHVGAGEELAPCNRPDRRPAARSRSRPARARRSSPRPPAASPRWSGRGHPLRVAGDPADVVDVVQRQPGGRRRAAKEISPGTTSSRVGAEALDLPSTYCLAPVPIATSITTDGHPDDHARAS